MSNEMRLLAFIAICLFMTFVLIVGHIVLTKCLNKNNSLEGENQDVIP